MIDLVPVFFIAFKAIVFGVCMFLAIKWHYDQDRKSKAARALLLTGAKVIAVLTLLTIVLVYATLTLGQKLGLNLM
ncbi:hypothetical protein KIK84_11315 [Curvibacter sp. CHRR-16]|nr:hypothetical protein [Curvibacter sp. CHRR-16]